MWIYFQVRMQGRYSSQVLLSVPSFTVEGFWFILFSEFCYCACQKDTNVLETCLYA